MAVLRRGHHNYRYEDYVAVELGSTTKHEFHDGEIYAMAGGTEDHSSLSVNMLLALSMAAIPCGCRVHTSDLRVYVEAMGLATFPDVSVFCGPIQQHAPSPKSTGTNPTILVEVTSDSSEFYDTGFKLDAYKKLPSLREFILISHRKRCITVHRRDGENGWTSRVAMAGEHIAIEALTTELSVDAIYSGTSIA